jgi:hypothetical protein
VVDFAQATTLGQQAWVEAKSKSDFSIFRPHLEKIVALRQEYASFFPNYDEPYDALLDDFEPNMKTADVKVIFDNLRPGQVKLIKAIAAQPQVDDSFLHQPFDEKNQLEFGEQVITKFGFDWKRGRQDKAAHPFTVSFSINDVRITTRVIPDFLNPMLFGTMHECGHALYGMGAAPELERTGLEGGAPAGGARVNRAACGRTWWGGRCPSGNTSIPNSRSASPNFQASRWRISTRGSTRCSLRSSGWKRTKPPTTCTSCCAWSWKLLCSKAAVF